MMFTGRILTLLTLTVFLFLSGNVYGANSYDREITVKNDTRELAVEEAFKELLATYEDEDPIGFLDHVSDERFRQDYMTFTDALYTDFREYDIHRVDYWIDRVVSDHIKGFLWVRWEKRFESFNDGKQFTTTGYSRFLFDEINGKYLLIELAGNNLFGGSLQEWRDEVPQIVGQEAEPVQVVQDDFGNVSTPVDTGMGNTPVVVGLPDLVVKVTNLNGSTKGTVYFDIENIGNAQSATCQVSIFTNNKLATITVYSLNPGDSQSFDTNWYAPEAIITVDSYDEVEESNENNNSATARL